MVVCRRCEARAGPEYVIRKYTFYRNGTFLLLRHHYAEDSCSIATHTVLARGSVNLTGRSAVVSGAIDAKFHVDAVNVVPLNRQVLVNPIARTAAAAEQSCKFKSHGVSRRLSPNV